MHLSFGIFVQYNCICLYLNMLVGSGILIISTAVIRLHYFPVSALILLVG